MKQYCIYIASVEVNYRAKFLDGTVFKDTYADGQPDTLALQNAIYGLQLAFQRLHIGTKICLIFPSRLGYGTEGFAPTIPPNSILLFEIDFIQGHPHF